MGHIKIYLVIFFCVIEYAVLARRTNKARSFIAIRDYDFVGDDPVLAAELTRRMAKSRPPAEALRDDDLTSPPQQTLQSTPKALAAEMKSTALPSSSPPPALGSSRDWPTNKSYLLNYRRQYKYWDLKIALKKQTHYNARGHASAISEYPADYNFNHLYSMDLKVAEQIIYGLQQRIEEMERVTKMYEDNQLLRMAFIMRDLDKWIHEMNDFYRYSHMKYLYYNAAHGWIANDNTANNPWYFTNYRHILYYQAILRRYIDVIYTVEYLRKIHNTELVRSKENNMEELLDEETMNGMDKEALLKQITGG